MVRFKVSTFPSTQEEHHHRFSKQGLHEIIGLSSGYGLLGPVWNQQL